MADVVAREPSWQQTALLERRLSEGQRLLRRTRWAVAGAMLCVGGLCALLYAHHVAERGACAVLDGSAAAQRGGTFWSPCCFWAAGLFWLRCISFSLAPLSDDVALARLVLAVNAVLLLADEALAWLSCPREEAELFYCSVSTVCVVLVLLMLLVLSRDRRARAMQARVWRAFQAYGALTLLEIAVDTAHDCLFLGYAFYLDGWLFPTLLATLFFSRPEPRDGCHALFALLVDRRMSAAAAAGIAGLVGDCPPKAVLAQAAPRFRGVRLCDLPFEAMASSTPDPGAFELSRPLGPRSRCDAFVSHSWHDEAAAKWGALQAWRADFVAARGREPVVWLDRCCIDQTNIDADLRCLPIFLSRCDELLILRGKSYLSRLWCVVELFAYVHVGAGLQQRPSSAASPGTGRGRLSARLVLRQGHEEEDRREIEGQRAAFDAGQCLCSRETDKERMLQIVRAAFGSLPRFNAAVSEILPREEAPSPA